MPNKLSSWCLDILIILKTLKLWSNLELRHIYDICIIQALNCQHENMDNGKLPIKPHLIRRPIFLFLWIFFWKDECTPQNIMKFSFKNGISWFSKKKKRKKKKKKEWHKLIESSILRFLFQSSEVQQTDTNNKTLPKCHDWFIQ